MRKIAISILLLVLPILGHAQEYGDYALHKNTWPIKNHRIGLSVSAGCWPEWPIDDYREKQGFGPDNDGECELPGYYAGFHLDYAYRLSNLIKVGVFAGYTYGKDCSDKDLNPNQTNMPKYQSYSLRTRSNLVYLMPSVRFDWYRNTIFRFYSNVALGAAYVNTYGTKEDWQAPGPYSMYQVVGEEKLPSENKVAFAYHASIIGTELGTQGFSAFFEMGAGFRGMFIFGLRAGF